jgi:hypothetical protein
VFWIEGDVTGRGYASSHVDIMLYITVLIRSEESSASDNYIADRFNQNKKSLEYTTYGGAQRIPLN